MSVDRPLPSHTEAAKQGVLFTIELHEQFLAKERMFVSDNGARIQREGVIQIGTTDTGEALLMDSAGLWRAPFDAFNLPDVSSREALTPEEYMNHVPDAMNALSGLAAKRA